MDVEDRFKRTDAELIDHIQEIRTANNSHWMDLLRLALEAQPDRAKEILRNIEACDTEVREAMKELAR